jgi:hypothetical protein
VIGADVLAPPARPPATGCTSSAVAAIGAGALAPYTWSVTPAFEALLDQALQLGEEERGELAARLLRSLNPDDGDILIQSEWDAASAAEIDRRVREVCEGRVQLVDGHGRACEIARRS